MEANGISTARRFGVAAGAAAAAAALATVGLATVGPVGPAAADSRSGSRSASVEGDTLTVTGSNRGEQIVLRLAAGDADTLEVDLGGDGSAERSFDRATFSRIEVLARGGRDQVRIDEGNGAFADETIAIDGGSGADTIDGGSGDELLVGGRGGDTVDGNGGADTGVLGSGSDTFRWDPGDGSDVVEGRSGADTLDFNGAGAAEDMSFTANGRRTLLFRDVGNIRMDMDDVEALDLTTLGGVDTVTVGDMSGTDARFAGIDLSSPTGGPDGLADTVTVTGSRRGDDIEVDTRRGRVEVDGLRPEVEIAGAEPADHLSVLAGDGDDEVEVDDDVEDIIGVTVDLGRARGDPPSGTHRRVLGQAGGDAAGGLGDGGAVAGARAAGRPLDRAAHADGGHRRTAGDRHRGADRGHAGRPLGDALDPGGTPGTAGRHRHRQGPAARAPVERQPGPDRHDGPQLVRALERLDAHPLVAVAHEQLDRLAGLVPQPLERRPGVHPPGDGLGGGVAEPDQAQAQGEPPLAVAPDQAVHLERHGQPVGGGPGQAGGRHHVGQRPGPRLERAQHRGRFVEHTHTA